MIQDGTIHSLLPTSKNTMSTYVSKIIDITKRRCVELTLNRFYRIYFVGLKYYERWIIRWIILDKFKNYILIKF